jgi:5-methyltetrahydrofolate--homocysteine methyltransferase
MSDDLKAVYESVIGGDEEEVQAGVQRCLDSGVQPATILTEALVGAMADVGERFERGDFFVPEMLVSARAMKAGLALLKPHLVEGMVKSSGTVVLGTVKGDLHDIGKNLVGMMLEGAGFDVVDLGADVPAERFVAAAEEHNAQIIGLSALLTTTMLAMQSTVQELQKRGLRERVQVMVGGAPVTEEFARSIGADGYAPDASKAVGLARSLLE